MSHSLISLVLWLGVTSVYLIDTVMIWGLMGSWTNPSGRQAWLAAPFLFAFVALLFTPWTAWAVGLLLGGLGLHLGAHRWGLRALRGHLQLAPLEVVQRVHALADRWGTPPPDRICTDPFDMLDPGVMGLLRQTLVLPASACALAEAEFEAVIAHELAHIAKRDPLKLWLTSFAGALTYWLPGGSRLARSIALEVEMAADSRAAEWTGDREGYALALGRWGLRRSAPHLNRFGVALTGTSSHLMLRLKAVLDPSAIPPHLSLPGWVPGGERAMRRRGSSRPQGRPLAHLFMRSIHLILPAGYLIVFLLLLRLVP